MHVRVLTYAHCYNYTVRSRPLALFQHLNVHGVVTRTKAADNARRDP